MILSHVVAMAKNRTIGVDGKLPWHIPEDLKFFKETTINHTIVMGRKTYDSIGKALPKRRNIVLTRDKSFKAPGVEVFNSIDVLLVELKRTSKPDEEIFIVGGGEIYNLTLDVTDKIYITRVDGNYNGDAKYPEFENKFQLVSEDKRQGDPSYSFQIYDKK